MDDNKRPVIIKQHESMCFNMKKAYYLFTAKCLNRIPYLLQMGISFEFGKTMTAMQCNAMQCNAMQCCNWKALQQLAKDR